MNHFPTRRHLNLPSHHHPLSSPHTCWPFGGWVLTIGQEPGLGSPFGPTLLTPQSLSKQRQRPRWFGAPRLSLEPLRRPAPHPSPTHSHLLCSVPARAPATLTAERIHKVVQENT